MRASLLAWAVCAVLLLCAGAGTAMADTGGQDIGQLALSQQAATANADSTQVKPTNQNISVRVLSPGDDGTVTQSNTSAALAAALNHDSTSQSAEQAGAGAAQQAIGQLAHNGQYADASADSTQVKPTNRNISVRVLSPGDDGDVTQSNRSLAGSLAANKNETTQDAGQAGSGSCGCQEPVSLAKPEPKPKPSPSRGEDCGCQKDGTAVQAIGQAAFNQQAAESNATSKQIGAKNSNVPVRVLSPGAGGSVTQRNDSAALSLAANRNSTRQSADQRLDGLCGCDGVAIQALGQLAKNGQYARSDATSFQLKPENFSAPVDVLGQGKDDGCGCDAGDGRRQTADGGAQVPPYAEPVPSGRRPSPDDVRARPGGSVLQENRSAALSAAVNGNALEQLAGQQA